MYLIPAVLDERPLSSAENRLSKIMGKLGEIISGGISKSTFEVGPEGVYNKVRTTTHISDRTPNPVLEKKNDHHFRKNYIENNEINDEN